MRITGRVGSHILHILVDSGSTHNFLDTTTAKKLRCELQKIPPLMVAVADGAQLQCQWVCKGFEWALEDVAYKTDAYIVPLGSCDMILGVQWLATLGSILWNFGKLTMQFRYKGEKQILQGQTKEEVRWVTGQQSKLFSNAVQLFAVQITPALPENTPTPEEDREVRLGQLLQDFAALFEEPKALPPHRSHDHRITLKEETSPISVRPYRYYRTNCQGNVGG